MWLITQQDAPGDYVLGTGEKHSVREFAQLAFKKAGIEIEWRGEGQAETGIDKATGKVRVKIDPKYYRPTEVDLLIADPRKAKEKLGWVHKTSFDELVSEMVAEDLAAAMAAPKP